MAVVILGYPLFGGAAWRPVSIAFRAYRMTLLRRWLRTEKVDGPVHNKLGKACPFAQRAPIRATVQEAPILISAYLPTLPSPARLPLFGNQFLERLDPGIREGSYRDQLLSGDVQIADSYRPLSRRFQHAGGRADR